MITTLVKHIENSTWKATVRSFPASQQAWDNPKLRYRYTTKILSIEYNLRHPHNPKFRRLLLDGEIDPRRVCTMKPFEIFPELWEPVFERIASKQLRKQLTHDVETMPDGALQCKKCKSRKTTYTQLQTRSADEPITTFALCMMCGRRWKE